MLHACDFAVLMERLLPLHSCSVAGLILEQDIVDAGVDIAYYYMFVVEVVVSVVNVDAAAVVLIGYIWD